ncbi:dynamin family protein [Sulfurovum sp.]|uniref:dynamin family protein n=1 Tax=Sulfurovum sp. TaxID=1969726 RepID=UPI0025F77ADE|nr:dynamin family protein [Sulfurovum sp.]
MELVNQLKSLENIIAKHHSLIEKESRNLISEFSISKAEETQREIDEIENSNRLLQIGIVGRVNAGKSSLLNALLFDGKSVLPKAATPMTAALAVISYGEELSAEVEFFSQHDIDNIQNDAKQYEAEFKRLLKLKQEELKGRKRKKLSKNDHQQDKDQKKLKIDKSELEKIEARVKRELDKSEPSLSASHDQYQRIKESGIDPKNLENSKVVPFDNIDSLAKDLSEYVGSSGRYMPFTKSVHLRIPQENLKNIQIVDTPGVNDPVVSREERTRELLKFCDVVFIVSPAGQFMSNEDLELMDRITSKEGVRELFVIASKCDMQLYGSIKKESGGDLYKAFNSMTTDLASSLHSTLSKLKNDHPEIGDAYDKLIAQSKESIIHSSGIALTIKEAYDNQSVLDSGEAHAWGMLVENYPDYFSETDKKLTIPSLDLLSNMNVIQKVIADVRDKKDQILAKRKEEFIKAKTDSLERYKKELLKYIELSIEDINDGDVDELKARRKRLNHIKLTVSGLVDEEYYDLVDELKINMGNKLKNELNSYFKQTNRDIDSAEGSDTENYDVEKDGFLSWGARKLGLGGYETRTRTFTTVRAGAVRSALSDLTIEIESAIKSVSDTTVLNWRKSLVPTIVGVLRDNADDEDINPSQIRKVVRNVINRVEFPTLSYEDNLIDEETDDNPTNLGIYGLWGHSNTSLRSATGTLTKRDAESFLDEAKDYVNSLKKRVNSDIDSYLGDLISNLKGVEISKEIFSEYDAQLEDLAKQIENKEITLDEYNKLKKEIGELR